MVEMLRWLVVFAVAIGGGWGMGMLFGGFAP
jgi:hypothetical protein